MPVSEMFNPKHYEGVRKPLLEATTMPAWTYTSPEFYRREIDRIWKKVWNFIGSVDQVPNMGDFFTRPAAQIWAVLRTRSRGGTPKPNLLPSFFPASANS